MNRFSSLLGLAAILTSFGATSTSLAQSTPDGKPTSTAGTAHGRDHEDSAPAKILEMSRALSGKWHLDVKFAPMGGLPNGIAGNGEESWHEGPGGFTFIEEEQIPAPGGTGYLLGIFWWDTKTKALQGMECNNQMPSTCDLKGALADITIGWDGKVLAIHEVETHDGKKTVWHETWSNITSTSFLQTGDVTQPDGSTTRFMTILGTKAKE